MKTITAADVIVNILKTYIYYTARQPNAGKVMVTFYISCLIRCSRDRVNYYSWETDTGLTKMMDNH